MVGLTTTGVHAQVNSICSLMSCLDYTSRQQYIYYPSNVFCMVSRCDFVLRLMSKTFDMVDYGSLRFITDGKTFKLIVENFVFYFWLLLFFSRRYGVAFYTYWLSMSLSVTTPGCSVKGFISIHYWYWHLQMRRDCWLYAIYLDGVSSHI